MVTSAGLKQQFDAKTDEIEQLVSGVTDEQASKAPKEGEWCIREVLTHLSGDAEQTFQDGLKRFVQEETPDLGLTPGQTYAAGRENIAIDELARDVVVQYRQIADWAGSLSDEQLSRTARIPFLKETPLGETPTLQVWLGAMLSFHLPQHIDQLKALRQ